MPVLGEISVQVEHGGQTKQLTLIIVEGEGQTLLGRDWFRALEIDLKHVLNVTTNRLEEILEQHKSIFKEELGTVKTHHAALQIRESQPKFHKARPVPFAIKETVGAELDRLESEGIIQKVSHSDWAAPIVAVPKKDGRFRICGDYKVTVNTVMDVDQYPLPNPSDMFATLAGGQKFSKLDLSQAYQQLILEEDSKKYSRKLWISSCKVSQMYSAILTIFWLQALLMLST